MCWKSLKKNWNFVEAFSLLGENWSVEADDGIIPVLEQYICTIYGYPREKKYTKGGKVINMALLPSCNSPLLFHVKRSNYVAKIWISSVTSWLDADKVSEKSWLPDRPTNWVDDVFPWENTM